MKYSTKYIYRTHDGFAFGASDTDPKTHATGTIADLVKIALAEGYSPGRNPKVLPCTFIRAKREGEIWTA